MATNPHDVCFEVLFSFTFSIFWWLHFAPNSSWRISLISLDFALSGSMIWRQGFQFGILLQFFFQNYCFFIFKFFLFFLALFFRFYFFFLYFWLLSLHLMLFWNIFTFELNTLSGLLATARFEGFEAFVKITFDVLKLCWHYTWHLSTTSNCAHKILSRARLFFTILICLIFFFCVSYVFKLSLVERESPFEAPHR